MTTQPLLAKVYDGWDSHQLALERTVAPLVPEQLAWRPASHLGSVGELISHLALARLYWFHQMGAPGSADLARGIPAWDGSPLDAANPGELQRWIEATVDLEESIVDQPADLLWWLRATWQMIDTTLAAWTVADLTRTYRRAYQGRLYDVSRQWTIWRIMSHDLHHGGELSLLVGLQGIDVPDLGDQGGHLTELPLAESI